MNKILIVVCVLLLVAIMSISQVSASTIKPCVPTLPRFICQSLNCGTPVVQPHPRR